MMKNEKKYNRKSKKVKNIYRAQLSINNKKNYADGSKLIKRL